MIPIARLAICVPAEGSSPTMALASWMTGFSSSRYRRVCGVLASSRSAETQPSSIPSIGCSCAVCCSPDPRDTRTRCSVVVLWQGRHLLVDTAPELRQQVIRSHVRRVDALLYTHSHADHIFGLDDVRRYNELQGVELPVFGREDVLDDLRSAFSYIFRSTQQGGGKPRLALTPIEGDYLEYDGLRVEAIPILHGQLP